jgi:putative molybdopterin biosynthesis protein
VIQPLPRGAGTVTSLVRADALLRVPLLSEGCPAGAEVDVELLRPWEQIAHTTVVVGSHDLVLDILANLVQVRHPGCRLISSHVGSMGGLTALLKGEAHMAGVHLLDEQTGMYNLQDVQRILGERHMILMNLSYRTQGLLVRKGNPLEIRSVADLARPGVRFINRQRGSGTRLLFDYLLGQSQVASGQIAGYEREEYTHMAIAVAVASQNADAGLGIQAAAVSLGLDFIPVGEERYDLCIPAALWDHSEVSTVRDLLHDPEFRNSVSGLQGYDFRDCGSIMGRT